MTGSKSLVQLPRSSPVVRISLPDRSSRTTVWTLPLLTFFSVVEVFPATVESAILP